MVSFTKSNLSLQKNIFLCSTESSLNYSLIYSILCSLFNTVRSTRLARAGLLRKHGFLPAKSRFEISNRFQQFVCCAGIMTICRGSGEVGESQRVNQQRSVSQQQQDICGFMREKVIIVEKLLVVLSVGYITAQLNRVNLLFIRQEFSLNHNAGTGVYSMLSHPPSDPFARCG